MKESKLIGVRFPIEELERLRESKWILRKSVNLIVRESVKEYLDRNLKKVQKRRSSK